MNMCIGRGKFQIEDCIVNQNWKSLLEVLDLVSRCEKYRNFNLNFTPVNLSLSLSLCLSTIECGGRYS